MSSQVRVITLLLDGKEVSARNDQTILQVARENNLYIPTLCHLSGLSLVGACRLCLVEVKGAPRLLPACVTLVQENMEVTLNTERVSKYRTDDPRACCSRSETTSARFASPTDTANSRRCRKPSK